MKIKDIFFDIWYRLGKPDWVINEPQPELIKAHEEGYIVGTDIIDIGCGSGDNSIYLASKGFNVTGVDVSPKAVSISTKKAKANNVVVDFVALDAFKLSKLNKKYDMVIDYGLLHQFDGPNLSKYIESIASISKNQSKLLLQCFSDQNDQKEKFGPRLISKPEIERIFSHKWKMEWIYPAVYKSTKNVNYKAWQAYLTYQGDR